MDLPGTAIAPLPGGLSGETFLAQAAGERSVVRIYAARERGSQAVEVDAAVLRLVRGLLPVPEVREVRRPDPVAGTPALLVTSFLPGRRLDLALPDMALPVRQAVGRRLGAVLARLAQIPMLRAGPFVDPELSLGTFPSGGDDLGEWVEGHSRGTALAQWAPEEIDGLREVAERAQTLLDEVDRASLVHGDFNPKNLLVDPDTAEVTGVVDWEFARAGSPYDDLGNLLRHDREPAFVEAVLDGFTTGLVSVPGNVVDLARAGDLYSLVDLAARRDAHRDAGRGAHRETEREADRAHGLLLAIARAKDLHAAPPAPGGR